MITVVAVVAGGVVAGAFMGAALFYLTVSLSDGRRWDGSAW